LAAVEGHPESFAPGREVGGYTVERELGRSGAAWEYAGTDPEGRAVQIRVVDPDTASSPEYRSRFEREARIARDVTHPNLVGVVDSGEHDGALFLVHPRVGERTLATSIAEEGALDPREAVRLCEHVAAALDALHAAGVVHRDVCPANVVLDSEGGGHLAGFALAKDTQGTALTEAGSALGSVDYMAPEQIRGEPVGAAADVYALACVAFECLAGRPPFADRAGMRVLWAHLQDQPPPLAELAPAAGAELSAAVARGLAKDPEARPRSASQLARVLALALELEEG
jgi:serine/threonine protein kinase